LVTCPPAMRPGSIRWRHWRGNDDAQLSRLGLSPMLTASLGACSQQSTYADRSRRGASGRQESWNLTVQQALALVAGIPGSCSIAWSRRCWPPTRTCGWRAQAQECPVGADLADTNLTLGQRQSRASGTKNSANGGSASGNLALPQPQLRGWISGSRLAAARDRRAGRHRPANRI
jgi:hypothetical protein